MTMRSPSTRTRVGRAVGSGRRRDRRRRQWSDDGGRPCAERFTVPRDTLSCHDRCGRIRRRVLSCRGAGASSHDRPANRRRRGVMSRARATHRSVTHGRRARRRPWPWPCRSRRPRSRPTPSRPTARTAPPGTASATTFDATGDAGDRLDPPHRSLPSWHDGPGPVPGDGRARRPAHRRPPGERHRGRRRHRRPVRDHRRPRGRPERRRRQRRPPPLPRRSTPHDEAGWTELWGLHNTGQRLYQGEPGHRGPSNVDIDGLQALGITRATPIVVVAVIDDGVDFSHPDLAGQAWTNPGESGGGRRPTASTTTTTATSTTSTAGTSATTTTSVHDFDDDFHGTHVAGTIAASLDGDGIVGVAPGHPDHGPQVHQRQQVLRLRLAGHRGHHVRQVVRRPDRQRVVGRARPPGSAPGNSRARSPAPGCSFVAVRRERRHQQRPQRLPGHARVLRPAEHPLGRRHRQPTAASPASRTTARRPSTSRRPGRRS